MAIGLRRLREWVRLIRSGLPASQAARRIGLTAKQVAEAMARTGVAGAVARAEEEALDGIEARLFRAALRGDPRAALAILQARRPEQWRASQGDDDLGDDQDGAWSAIAGRMAERLQTRDGNRATPLLPPPADAAGTPSPAGPAPAGVPSPERTECPPSLPEPDAPPSGQSN